MTASNMKTLRASLIAATALTAAALVSPAQAQTAAGAYVGVGAGLNIPTNSNTILDGTTPAHLNFDTGYNLIGTMGYKWDSHIRTEFEIGYRRAGVDNINGAPAIGHQGTLSFSGNLLYDFPLTSVLTPYVGGGLGVAREHFGSVNTGPTSPDFDDSATHLQWQLIGGISTPLGSRASLFAEYRYIGVTSSTFEGPTGDILQGHYDHSHNILAGVRFYL